jgi:glutaredoxin
VTSRVTLYVRPGCHLCDDARQVVETVCAEADATWDEVDIDSAGSDSLRERMTDIVPVVEVDGHQVGYWRIRADNVRAALARGGRQ